MTEIYRWRICLSRHIKKLAGFNSQSSCDRRLKKLLEAEYITRKKYLYGVPYIYNLTHRGKVLISVSNKIDKIRLEQIIHDITVLDVAIYIHDKYKIEFHQFTTEKQMHIIDGFGNRKHQPDFIFKDKEGKKTSVEIELSQKSKSRLENNIQSNFHNFDNQIWFVSDLNNKIFKILDENRKRYTDIKILELSKIKHII